MDGIKIHGLGWDGQDDGRWQERIAAWRTKDEAASAKFMESVRASTAYEFSRMESERKIAEDLMRRAAERKRKVEDATIELNEETKRQNDYLKAQLKEAQKSNDLLAQQINVQIGAGKRARRIAVVSVLVAFISLAFTVWRYLKGQ